MTVEYVLQIDALEASQAIGWLSGIQMTQSSGLMEIRNTSGEDIFVGSAPIYTYINGKTDAGLGDQWLFGDFSVGGAWEIASGVTRDKANNFHFWQDLAGPCRVEFENETGELQFYIESGVGKDVWYGCQRAATTEWCWGHDDSQDAWVLCDGFGLTDANTHIRVGDTSIDFLSGGETADLHRPIVVHQQTLFDVAGSPGESVVQLASTNAGSVGSSIILTNQEDASNGHHWMFQHKGTTLDNQLHIGYHLSASSGTNLLTASTGLMTVETDGRIGLTSELSAATGDEAALTINYTTNKATSGNDTGLIINQTDTASPGTSHLIDLQVAGASKFSVNNAGDLSTGGSYQNAATETTMTPSGASPSQGMTCNDCNHQTLVLTSASGIVTFTLTVPSNIASGTIIIKQHAVTPVDITWAVSSGSIVWMGGEPDWSADAIDEIRLVAWRYDGTDMYLAATAVNA
jgi:hypothetical protein